MKKRLLSFLLSLMLLLTVFPMVTLASDYETHWAGYHIYIASQRGLLTPDSEGNYKPDQNATRGEFAQMLWLALDKPAATGQSPFGDVSEKDSYCEAVSALYEAKVVAGTGNGMFSPHKNLTREMAFAMISRAFDLAPVDENTYQQFSDANDISEWARSAVSALKEKRFVVGVGGNRCAAKQYLTRGQMTKLLVEISDAAKGKTDPRVMKVVAGTGCFGALDSAGKVYVWGSNWYGQCEVPENLPKIVDLGLGCFHAVALDENGKLHGWGEALGEELSFSGSLPPFVAVAVAGYSTTALTADGKVYQWSSTNGAGQDKVPKEMPPIQKIYASAYFTLAVDGSGKTYEWGMMNSVLNMPVKVAAFAPLPFHTAALGVNGKIYGDVKHANMQYYYKKMPDMQNVSNLFGGVGNLAAIDKTGNVYVWGEYERTEGKGPCVEPPVNLPPVTQVAMLSGDVACLGIDGKVYQWGERLGDEGVPDAINGFLTVSPEFAPFRYPEVTLDAVVATEDEFFSAVQNKSRTITIQKSFDISHDLGIQPWKTLTVEPGVTLGIRAQNVTLGNEQAKLVNKGTIRVYGPYGRVMVYGEVHELGKIETLGQGARAEKHVSSCDASEIERVFGGASVFNALAVVPGEATTVLIDRDVTIPKGKTLWLNDYCTLKVAKGVTLTVEGTLETYHQPIIEGKVIGKILVS